MKRIQGEKNQAIIERLDKNHNYRIRWDFKPFYNKEGIETCISFLEKDFNYIPNIDEIKSVILSSINEDTDEKILSGYIWKNMVIWLSQENQFNYKAAYDLAVQTNGKNLPVTFKFGGTENPVYYTFNDIDELSEFYAGAIKHINDTLNEGWQKKDNFDWSIYEKALYEINTCLRF